MDIPRLTRKRITVDEFQKMAAAGVWKSGNRLELIEGEMLDMESIDKDHAALRMLLNELFIGVVLEKIATLSVGGPLQLGGFTQTQPDLMILKRREDSYRARLPQASDVLLLGEIYNGSQTDLRYKLAIYARHGVLEYWTFDLERRRVRIFQEPAPDGYDSVRTARPGEELGPLACPSVKVHLSRVFD